MIFSGGNLPGFGRKAGTREGLPSSEQHTAPLLSPPTNTHAHTYTLVFKTTHTHTPRKWNYLSHGVEMRFDNDKGPSDSKNEKFRRKKRRRETKDPALKSDGVSFTVR